MTFRTGFKNKTLLYILLLFPPFTFATPGHFYVGGILGPSFSTLENNHFTINYYNGQLTDAYPLNQNYRTSIEWGFNGGYELTGMGVKPAIALGVGLYNTPLQNFQGQVFETAMGDPTFLLYNYKAQVCSTRLMAEMQLNWMIHSFFPFINVGVGPAWNRAMGYSETVATPDGYVAVPPFQSQTQVNFAYQVGFGVGYAFNWPTQTNCNTIKKERLSLGYRYVDTGNVSYGTRGSEYPYSFNLGRLTSNTVSLIYTHVF